MTTQPPRLPAHAGTDSEQRLRSLGDNLPDSYVYQSTLDADGKIRFLYLSSGVERIHGLTPAAVIENADRLYGQVDPADLAGNLAEERDSLARMADFVREFRVRRADGELRWLSVRSHPSRQADGQILWDGVVSDITAQKDNEEALSLLTRRALYLLSLPDLADTLGEMEFMQRGLEMAEELSDSTISFLHFAHEDAETIELAVWSRGTLEHYCTAVFDRHYPISRAGIWADAFRRRQAVVFNDYAAAPGKRGLPPGHAGLTRLITLPVIEAGKVVMLAGIGNKPTDYTERDVETLQLLANDIWRSVRKKRAEQELHVALRALEASPVVSFRWLAREGWPVEYVSRNVSRWGYRAEDLMTGQPSYPDLIHPDDLTRIADEVARHTAAGASEYVQHYRLRAADGHYFWVEDSTHVLRDATGAASAYEGVVTDIDARKRYELELAENLARQKELNNLLETAHEQLLQSEKMAAIGQLAAGVAHELNNPIGFVHSNLGTLKVYLDDIFQIAAVCEAAAAEAAQPADFARIEAIKAEKDFDYLKTDIFQLLTESVEGLGRVKKIVQDLKDFSRPGESNWQWADLHQGLDSTLNIVWNELKYKCTVKKEYGALPRIRCLPAQLNQVFMNLLVNAAQAIETQGEVVIATSALDADTVLIRISDSGAGIAPEHMSHLFDPFFTTKPVGKGTGLGLAIAYGIVQKHRGRIEVSSEVGRGTTFTIMLPVDPGPEDATAS
jgi:PAS domain S-box-containing protein